MQCPLCENPAAHVRRMETRKRLAEGQAAPRQGGYVGSYYLFCAPGGGEGCGVVQAPGPAAQRRILSGARWHEGCKPADVPAMAKATPAAKPPAAPPAPRVDKPATFNPLDF